MWARGGRLRHGPVTKRRARSGVHELDFQSQEQRCHPGHHPGEAKVEDSSRIWTIWTVLAHDSSRVQRHGHRPGPGPGPGSSREVPRPSQSGPIAAGAEMCPRCIGSI